jgi:hypothetical protein
MTDNVIVTQAAKRFTLELNKFAQQHDLQPVEAMLLPGLFRKAAKVVDQAILRFTENAFENEELGFFLAAQARKIGATDEAKKLWEEHLQEGAA